MGPRRSHAVKDGRFTPLRLIGRMSRALNVQQRCHLPTGSDFRLVLSMAASSGLPSDIPATSNMKRWAYLINRESPADAFLQNDDLSCTRRKRSPYLFVMSSIRLYASEGRSRMLMLVVA